MKQILLFLLSLLQLSHGQNPIVQGRPKGDGDRIRNPFLSTTLSARITYSESSSSYLDFGTARKSAFSEALARFLTKVFGDQEVYDLKIISVNIFDDHVLKDGEYAETTREHNSRNEEAGDGGGHTLAFSTVVSAEYTDVEEINSIADESFRKMLVHVVDKFQDHLIKFMQDTGDPYFMDVEKIVLADFVRFHGASELSSLEGGGENQVMGMSQGTLNAVSIVAIVVGCIAFVLLAYASVKYYRKEKQLKAAVWRSKELASLNGGTLSSANSTTGGRASHPIVLDDYSFNPLGSSPGAGSVNQYTGTVPPYTDYRDDPIHTSPSANEEEIAFSSVWPESAPPSLFPGPETSTNAPPAQTKLSYSEELQRLPKQQVFAPPGKIGVAIDVYNGQPTVHKVRKGSPLEKMLRPNDVILAIDDEDTSCLSAADVTQLMVKRMDRVRKITFVRRE